jgi:hypothetical protein
VVEFTSQNLALHMPSQNLALSCVLLFHQKFEISTKIQIISNISIKFRKRCSLCSLFHGSWTG